MNKNLQVGLLCGLVFLTGCTTQQSILKTPMPNTFDEWCLQDMKEYGQVLVTGHVRAPGVYSLVDAPDLARAIQVAGGYMPLAAPASIRLDRKGKITRYNLRRKRGAAPVIVLRSGDIIVVPQRLFYPETPPPVKFPARWKKAKRYYDRNLSDKKQTVPEKTRMREKTIK